jgi:hypothetical protein
MLKKNYYRKRDNTFYTDKTKSEIITEIDPFNPDTFMPYLKILNFPYFEEEWKRMVETWSKPEHRHTIFGRYLAKMRLCSFRNFTYEDNEYIKEMAEIGKKKREEYLELIRGKQNDTDS